MVMLHLGYMILRNKLKLKRLVLVLLLKRVSKMVDKRLEEAGLNVSSLCKVASLKGNQVTLLGENE